MVNEQVNEHLATRVKINNRTVTYTCWDRKKSVFANRETLSITTTPGKTSCSVVVDQHIMDFIDFCVWLICLQFVCLFIFFGVWYYLFSWFCCCIVFLFEFFEKEFNVE